MMPIESHLFDCLEKTKTSDIGPNKNYFAMSLKLFFMTLTEDELELMCHNYVHNWINEELKRSNRLLSKYQVEQKLEYINNEKPKMGDSMAENKSLSKSYTANSLLGGQSNSKQGQAPRYMNPTSCKINKQ